MTIETNKALVWRFFIEVLNDRNLAGVDELFAPGFLDHTEGCDHDLNAFLSAVKAVQIAFPDLEVTILDQVADRDRVVTRCTTRGTHLGPFAGWMATACRVKLDSVHIFRVHEYQIIEHWGMIDHLGLLRQIGALAELISENPDN